MLRLLWHSNAPWIGSGYGNQTALFVPRLNSLGYPTAIAAFVGIERGVMDWNGVRVYPKLLDRYGNDAIGAHSAHFKADGVITLCDVSMLQPQAWARVPWIPWVPVDALQVRPNEIAPLKRAFQPVAMSRYGEQILRDAGVDPAYAPHGVDCGVFRPGDKADCRDKVRLPKDRFIVGVVAANQGRPSRKAFAEMFLAFRDFKRKHDDAFLYVHSYLESHLTGPNLARLLTDLGLQSGRDWMTCPDYLYLAGLVSPAEMRLLYCSMDVLMNVSWGEGFGIPIVEAQACGVPVIVGDWTAMPELCFSGWTIDKADARLEWNNFDVWQYSPNPGAIAEALELAYNDSRMTERGQVARERALEYDADAVMRDYWLPIVGRLEAQIANQEIGMVQV